MYNSYKYIFWVDGEPVAKTTQRPPRGKASYWIVQTDPQYLRLKATWAYQKYVGVCSRQAYPGLTFGKNDPIELSLEIYKTRRKTGDTKNIIAAIEDGLQYAGVIPDDRQVTSYGAVRQYFMAGKEKAGVRVAMRIDPRVDDLKWLAGWLGSKKKAVEYQRRLGIINKGCKSTV